MNWLKSTFLYIRFRKNPKYYSSLQNLKNTDEFLRKIALESLQSLDKAKIIEFDEDGFGVTPLEPSHIMSKHLINFASMKEMMSLHNDSGLQELLHTLCQCRDVQLPLRRSEKKTLNSFHKDVRYKIKSPLAPSKVKVTTDHHKSYVLLQAFIGRFKIDDFTMNREISECITVVDRILQACLELATDRKHAKLATHASKLSRSLNLRLWGVNDAVLTQVHGIGPKIAEKLSDARIRSFADVLRSTPNALEKSVNRSAPFGAELQQNVQNIMNKALVLRASMEGGKVVCDIRNAIAVEVDRENTVLSNKVIGSKIKLPRLPTCTLVVSTDHPDGLLVFRQSIKEVGKHYVRLPQNWGVIHCELISNYVGLDSLCDVGVSGPSPYKTIKSPFGSSSAFKTPINDYAMVDTSKLGKSTVNSCQIVTSIKLSP